MPEVDNSSPTMANQPTTEMKSPRPDKGSKPSPVRRLLRRALFVILLLLVVIGIGVAGVVLNRRLAAATEQNAALRADLDSLSGQVDELRQALDTQAVQHQTDVTALEERGDYVTVLLRAQMLAAKGQLDLAKEEVGDARNTIGALQESLAAAAELAPAEDAATLADLKTRAEAAGRDLADNPFAAGNSLEEVWRGLDELTAAQVATQ